MKNFGSKVVAITVTLQPVANWFKSMFYDIYFQVLIEFDDIDWTRREWIRVHDIFQLFLVEHTLVWAERPDPDKPKQSISWPGLVSSYLDTKALYEPYNQV